MKTKNTHGVYDHTSHNDQKAFIIATGITLFIIICTMITLLVVALYFKQLNDQDKRTEYINELHSELK